jgi:hypothetical protein
MYRLISLPMQEGVSPDLRKAITGKGWRLAQIADVPEPLPRGCPPVACIVWGGARNSWGYGLQRVAGTMMLAHRVSFQVWNGPIPDGYEVDHLCGRSWCIRPEHLRAVTPAQHRARHNRRRVMPKVEKVTTEVRDGETFKLIRYADQTGRPAGIPARTRRRVPVPG